MHTRPYTLFEPSSFKIPLVCDSPHSGTFYPSDFDYSASLSKLRSCEDTHVDELWKWAPHIGATLLTANFPRSYIDLNRAVTDIDLAMLEGNWPDPVSKSEKTNLGYGLIWRQIDSITSIYSRKLSVSEIQNRINNYYYPYYKTLFNVIKETLFEFGEVWHLNLHSMPNNAYERMKINNKYPLADFVLGDRDGTTCEPEFVDLIEKNLRFMGYKVSRNDPYKGMQIISEIGKPRKKQHSLQIEIRRPIYMDEKTRNPNKNFQVVKDDITVLLNNISEYLTHR